MAEGSRTGVGTIPSRAADAAPDLRLVPRPASVAKLAALKPNQPVLPGEADVAGGFNETAVLACQFRPNRPRIHAATFRY